VAEAAFWGFVGGTALIVGALVGLRFRMSRRWIGLIMGFGAGVLISALAFDLTEEAFERAGGDAVTIGLAAGSLTFFAGDWLLDRRGGEDRKASTGEQADGNPLAIVLGALLDGIPESVAIGVTLLEGTGVGAAFVVAVFLSNVPESLAAATGLKRAGWRERRILGLWTGVALVSAVAAALGYALLDGASQETIAVIQAFAAGAILTMLADTMFPEAFEQEGRSAVLGVVTVFGFTLAFLLTTLE